MAAGVPTRKLIKKVWSTTEVSNPIFPCEKHPHHLQVCGKVSLGTATHDSSVVNLSSSENKDMSFEADVTKSV